MDFQARDSYSCLLFKSNHILKLEDKILTENILFINKSFNSLLPPIFESWFIFCSDDHNYQTVSSTADKIFKPSYRTDSYGKNSITIGVINSWNKTQHQFSNLSLKTYSLLCVSISFHHSVSVCVLHLSCVYVVASSTKDHPIHFIYQSPSHSFHLPISLSFISSTIVNHFIFTIFGHAHVTLSFSLTFTI